MKASQRIANLRQSAERLERQGSHKAAAWYAKKADEAEKEAQAAQKSRPWQR